MLALYPPGAEYRCKNHDTNIIQSTYYVSHPMQENWYTQHNVSRENLGGIFNLLMLFSKIFQDVCMGHIRTWEYFICVSHKCRCKTQCVSSCSNPWMPSLDIAMYTKKNFFPGKGRGSINCYTTLTSEHYTVDKDIKVT